MRKILHIIDSLHTGGAEVLLVGTIKQLPSYEHHIIVLISEIAFPDIYQHATIHVLDHHGWSSSLRTIRKIRKIAHSVKPDIVHSHLFLASFFARMALRKHPKLIYTLHTLFSKAIFKTARMRWMEKMAYDEKHTLVAVSKYVLDDYKKVIYRCKGGYVLYNFIGNEFFEKDIPRRENKTGALNKWVAVGSLKAVKNYEGMIDLFAALYNVAKEKSEMQLDIYGEGSLKDELQHKIDHLRIPVRLMGKTDNIADILGQYDAYISTSIYEGYGIAPMEALAIGLPLFLSNIPVYKEVYQDHAFYFNNDEIASFLHSQNEYQQLTEEVKKSRQKSGKEYAYETANSSQYIRKLLEIY